MKTPNAPDSTRRNTRASIKRDDELLVRVQRIERVLKLLAPAVWRKTAKAKP